MIVPYMEELQSMSDLKKVLLNGNLRKQNGDINWLYVFVHCVTEKALQDMCEERNNTPLQCDGDARSQLEEQLSSDRKQVQAILETVVASMGIQRDFANFKEKFPGTPQNKLLEEFIWLALHIDDMHVRQRIQFFENPVLKKMMNYDTGKKPMNEAIELLGGKLLRFETETMSEIDFPCNCSFKYVNVFCLVNAISSILEKQRKNIDEYVEKLANQKIAFGLVLKHFFRKGSMQQDYLFRYVRKWVRDDKKKAWIEKVLEIWQPYLHNQGKTRFPNGNPKEEAKNLNQELQKYASEDEPLLVLRLLEVMRKFFRSELNAQEKAKHAVAFEKKWKAFVERVYFGDLITSSNIETFIETIRAEQDKQQHEDRIALTEEIEKIAEEVKTLSESKAKWKSEIEKLIDDMFTKITKMRQNSLEKYAVAAENKWKAFVKGVSFGGLITSSEIQTEIQVFLKSCIVKAATINCYKDLGFERASRMSINEFKEYVQKNLCICASVMNRKGFDHGNENPNDLEFFDVLEDLFKTADQDGYWDIETFIETIKAEQDKHEDRIALTKEIKAIAEEVKKLKPKIEELVDNVFKRITKTYKGFRHKSAQHKLEVGAQLLGLFGVCPEPCQDNFLTNEEVEKFDNSDGSDCEDLPKLNNDQVNHSLQTGIIQELYQRRIYQAVILTLSDTVGSKRCYKYLVEQGFFDSLLKKVCITDLEDAEIHHLKKVWRKCENVEEFINRVIPDGPFEIPVYRCESVVLQDTVTGKRKLGPSKEEYKELLEEPENTDTGDKIEEEKKDPEIRKKIRRTTLPTAPVGTTTSPAETTTATSPAENTTATSPAENTTATSPAENTTATSPAETASDDDDDMSASDDDDDSTYEGDGEEEDPNPFLQLFEVQKEEEDNNSLLPPSKEEERRPSRRSKREKNGPKYREYALDASACIPMSESGSDGEWDWKIRKKNRRTTLATAPVATATRPVGTASDDDDNMSGSSGGYEGEGEEEDNNFQLPPSEVQKEEEKDDKGTKPFELLDDEPEDKEMEVVPEQPKKRKGKKTQKTLKGCCTEVQCPEHLVSFVVEELKKLVNATLLKLKMKNSPDYERRKWFFNCLRQVKSVVELQELLNEVSLFGFESDDEEEEGEGGSEQ